MMSGMYGAEYGTDTGIASDALEAFRAHDIKVLPV
jgi:hypothetical protein